MRRPSRRVTALALGAALVLLALPGVDAGALAARVVVVHPAPVPSGDPVVTTSTSTAFDVVLAQPHQAALTAFLAGLTNPSSANYQRFLTPREFARAFGAPASEVAAVRNYLSGFGLRVGSLSGGHLVLRVDGSTSSVARAFAAPVATVRTSHGLATQFTAPATLPRAVAQLVHAVVGLSTVQRQQPVGLATRSAHVATAGSCPSAGSSSGTTPNALGGYTVNQQANLYGLAGPWAQGDTGVGQTIGIYELQPYSSGDVNAFFSCYKISSNVSIVPVDGGSTGANGGEATLDIEEAAALAPGAVIKVYEAPNNSTGPIDELTQMANDDTASIISTSWGDCETDPTNDPNAEQPIFEQMAAQGQTVLSAAGDAGSSDCVGITNKLPSVDDPASQPFVTGVGGLSVNSTSPLSQTIWNDGLDSNGGAGGGGTSVIWSRPSWQDAPGISASATMRMVPDLSVMADPSTGFIYYFTGNPSGVCTSDCGNAWTSIGGTSIGSPLMSAIVAVAAQSCGVSRLGFLNPTLYAMARSGTGFNDVTTGNNDLYGVGVFSAGPGYDMASGLGSPNASTFIPGLCPATMDATTSTLTATVGNVSVPGPATVTLSAHDTHANALAGAVVHFSATTTAGVLEFDGQHASSTGTGTAAYDVTTDPQGGASVTLTSSTPGTVTIKVSDGAASLSTSVTFSAIATAPPGRASIQRIVPKSGGFTLTARPPASTGSGPITSYQYSITNGKSWVHFSAATRTVTVTRLSHAVTYHVIVRALNAYGAGAQSASSKVRTR
ncbi:MAG TPA: protease pro-enzyme activation domain-containing protein [Acidimicrobiales bacterium]|nr:protease pro-enzyme activation domain-containing protein [Acidimicrobiales bacterium]